MPKTDACADSTARPLHVEDNAVPATADRSLIERLLAGMTRQERLVVCLRYADGLTVEEIAAVLHAGATEVERMLEHVTRCVRLVVNAGAADAAPA